MRSSPAENNKLKLSPTGIGKAEDFLRRKANSVKKHTYSHETSSQELVDILSKFRTDEKGKLSSILLSR
jgi:hypothetical protein